MTNTLTHKMTVTASIIEGEQGLDIDISFDPEIRMENIDSMTADEKSLLAAMMDLSGVLADHLNGVHEKVSAIQTPSNKLII